MFVSPPWLEAISRTYGFTPRARIAIESGGKPIGGFAWVHVVDVRGERLCSLPFSDWADPIASDYSTWRALTAGIFDENTPLSLRCLHSAVPAQDPRLLQTEQLAWHGTQLDAPLPDIHRRLSPGARRNIAAASRNGLSVVTDTGVEAMREFHRMQVLLRKHKYRMLAQPLEFFENIWARFRLADAVVTITARAGSEPIAAAVFLQWNDTLHYKFGSSLQDRLQLRPNDAIYWAGIRWAAERGLSLVDWGSATSTNRGSCASSASTPRTRSGSSCFAPHRAQNLASPMWTCCCAKSPGCSPTSRCPTTSPERPVPCCTGCSARSRDALSRSRCSLGAADRVWSYRRLRRRGSRLARTCCSRPSR
ncbi:GNAT family N-acetyltransferase [Saccharopolyspora rosea]|uniref:GNAT family N-acetyltransferase n=1 Tax=Saccharopolyspora rosea TaxID=524884 RepID=UPI0021D9EFE1|nr:GNAT family N-acetyltransferase [Saccharopolyspora rosea]